MTVGLVSILIMLFGMIGAAGGQGLPQGTVMCGDLSDDDCAILEQSAAAMQELDSVAFDMQASIGVGGFEMAPGFDELAVNFEMHGAVSADLAAIAEIQSLSTTTDIAELYNPETLNAVADAYGVILNNTQMSIEMVMSLPPLVTALDPETPDHLDMQVLASEGIFYVYASDPTLPDGGEWIGIDLSNFGEMYQELLNDMYASGEMPNLEDLGDFSDLMDNAFFNLMYDPEFIGQFVTVTRLDDTEVDGEAVAVFETTYDYGAMFSDERLQTGFSDYLALFFGMIEDQTLADPEVFKQAEAMYSVIFNEMFGNMEMTQTQWIGLESFHNYHNEAGMVMSLDLMTFVEQIAELTDQPLSPSDLAQIPTDPLIISFDMSVDMHSFNEPVQVEVPEGVEVVDPFAEMPLTS